MTIDCRWAVSLALSLTIGTAVGASAQVRHAVGQNIAPVYEGWEPNADGTFTMVFGYMNRNYEEEPIIPVGPNNNLEPGGPDRGQPTHFYPRRQQFVFRVPVPKDWGNKDLVWTVTHNGRTDKAYGTLIPEFELADVVYKANRGMGIAGDPSEVNQVNQPPTIKVVGDDRTKLTLPGTFTLTVMASDDGLPKGRPAPPASPTGAGQAPSGRPGPNTQAMVKPNRQGLAVTWIHYRGAGAVSFDPMSQLVKDGKAVTTANFSAPGIYVLRAYADDGHQTRATDVTVTVSAGSASLK